MTTKTISPEAFGIDFKSNFNKPSTGNEVSIFSKLLRRRKESARLFPHCGERGEIYSKTYQGVKLPDEALGALKRDNQ